MRVDGSKLTRQDELNRILEALEATSKLDGLQKATEEIRALYRINHVVYHWVDSAGEQYGCGTYSDAWRARYLQQNYIRLDPVIIG